MTEVGIAEYFGMAEALGIISTLFVILYFSRRQMQALSVDIETKILNDLDERIHGITQMLVERPELIRVVNNDDRDLSSELAYSYHILYTFAHVYHMRQRRVVSGNEWTGWLRWMKSAFRHGNIREIWKNNIEVEKWFDPAFQEFINKELAPVSTKQ
jgi:hypothetical protein